MTHVKALLWCAVLVLALGCSPAHHWTTQASAQASPEQPDDSGHPAHPVPVDRPSDSRTEHLKLLPTLADAEGGSLVLPSSEDSDAILAAVVRSIVNTNRELHYFVGYQFHKTIVGDGDPWVNVDPSARLMHTLADLGAWVQPLSVYRGDGAKIALAGVFEYFGSNPRVFAAVYSGDHAPPQTYLSYVVQLKGGQWQVADVEPTYFK
jgi:hypothetical protein